MVICDMCATRKSSMNRKQAVGLLPVCRLNFAPLLVDTSSLLFVVNSHFHIYRVRIIKHVRTKEREREKGLRIKYHWFAEKEGNRIFCWQRKTLRPHRFISGAEKWTHSKNVWGKEFRSSDNDFYFFPLDLIFFQVNLMCNILNINDFLLSSSGGQTGGMTEEKCPQLVDYFVVAGLDHKGPWRPLDEDGKAATMSTSSSVSTSSSSTSSSSSGRLVEPVTDLVVISRGHDEEVPEGFTCIEKTLGGHSAELSAGLINNPHLYLCYRRGRDKPPILELGWDMETFLIDIDEKFREINSRDIR